MEISKAAAGLLVAACVTVGAGATYLTTRDGSVRVEQSEREPEAATAGSAVEHSDAVIGDPTPASEPVVVAPAPAPARRFSAAPPVRESRPQPARSAPAREVPERVDSPASEPRASVPAFEPPRVSDNQISSVVEPAGPQFEELVVAADSVIGLQLESTVTSERARVEDEVVARVTRDVRVGDRVAIPAGSRAVGEVTLVERGGRLRERARLGVRFTSIVLADGTRLPVQTETVFREGDAPGGESAAKIGGGAIGGAIIGGILGGAKGAAIGGSVGAGAGTAAVMAGGRNAATLSAGAPVTVRVEDPITVTVEK